MHETSTKWHMGLAIALISVLAFAVVESANATVLAQDTAGTLPNPIGFSAQSVTTPGGGPFTDITFNFYDSQGAPTAPGETLIILSQAFLGGGYLIGRGDPDLLPGFVAKSSSNSGAEYGFDPTVTLNSNQQYFFYIQNEFTPAGGQILIGGDTYSGGNYYSAVDSGDNFISFPNEDANFSLSGTPVPEPTSLAIMSVALFGLALLRHRRKRPEHSS